MTETNPVQLSKLVTRIMRLNYNIKDKPKKINKAKISTNQNN
jgi:hypothetical protein